MIKPQLLVIGGPTSSGKTGLAIALAQSLNAEIFSADSRQVYAEMSIGTAKPTPQELQMVRHHFVGCRSVNEPYTAGTFGKEVRQALNEYFKMHNVALLVGGSGLYIDAVTEGFDDLPAVPADVLLELEKELEAFGLESLQQELKLRDPQFAAQIDIKNQRRVIRGLSVIRTSGKTMTELLGKHRENLPFESHLVYLRPERQALYRSIESRVDKMMADGLLEEARTLHPLKDLKPLQTVGYQELFDHFEGKCNLEEAVSKIKQHTRNYAKRQYTWFNRKQAMLELDQADADRVMKHLSDEGIVS